MARLHLSTFQVGTPRDRAEGLRIAVTRFPQRGVPKARRAQEGRFDVWFPSIAPSRELLRRYTKGDFLSDPHVRKKFFDAYERELLSGADSRQTLVLLAEIARRMPISVGCFCEDESRCHRSRLRDLIARFASKQARKP